MIGTAQLPRLDRGLVMLDFDGTLVDLAATPDAIDVPDGLPQLLNGLHANSLGATLITGRSVADLSHYLPDFDGDIYGAHGAEHRLSGQYGQAVTIAADQMEQLWQGADAIAAKAPDTLIAERKPAGVVLHYRRAPQLADMVHRDMADLVADHAAHELHYSKMAIEIRPKGASKATAASAIIAAAPPAAVPLFAGDDTTDEPAMQVVIDMGGIAIKVGEGNSCASHHLPDPQAMRALLRDWRAGGVA